MTGIGFNRRGFLAVGTVGALGAGAALSGCATASDAAASASASHGTGSPSTGYPNTSTSPTIDTLTAQRIIPVLRDPTPDSAMRTAQAWIAAGCRAVELTTTTPDVFHVAMMLARDGITVGVGTLHNVDQVQQAADAGAAFALSFATWPGLISTATARGMLPIPGTMTPSEVYASLAAPIIKVFPASLLGRDYVRTLALLLPGIRTQVTGGIGSDPADARAWLDAGATIVGVDGDMFGPIDDVSAQLMTTRARDYLAAVTGP